MNSSQIPILIFLVPFLSSLVIPLFYKTPLMSKAVTAFALLASAILSLIGLWTVRNGAAIDYYLGGWVPPYGIAWRLDALSALMSLLISATAFVVIVATGPTVKREIEKASIPYYVIVLLHLSGLLGMVLTHDFFNLFVFLEVASLTGYALIATGDNTRGNVASLRYLLIGTVGASFYLLGVGYLYTATGTLNMTDLAARLPEVFSSRTVMTGILFMFLGLAIKMGLFPFHGWLPDAYTYASDSATALIAPLMTKTAIYAFVRIFIIVLGYPLIHQLGVPKLLMVLGAIAVMAGSIMAFIQPQFKRMLAYSSISHIGLIVIALGMNHPAAFVGAILHILNHAVMKASLFLTAAAAYERRAVRDVLNFGKLRGFMPLTLAGFAVAALSMAGVPPFCGFFSKWYILVGAVQSGHPVMAGVIVFSSLLTALYFFKVIEKAFFQKADGPKPVMAEAPVPLLLSGVFLSALILILGLVSPLLFSWGMRALVEGVT